MVHQNSSKFANEETIAMGSKSAPCDKKTLSDLGVNAARVSLSDLQQDAVAKLLKP